MPSVISWVRNNPIKLVIALLLTLNCFGFCYKRMWFLSDQERIEIAIRYELNFIEGVDWWGTAHKLPFKEGNVWKYHNEIPYGSMEEFFALNPDCCKVSRSYTNEGTEGDYQVSMLGCLTGLSPYMVSGEYQVRHTEGQVKATTVMFAYKMSSCGVINLRNPGFRREKS